MKVKNFQKKIANIDKVGDYKNFTDDQKVLINTIALGGETDELLDKMKKQFWYEQDNLKIRYIIQRGLVNIMYHVAELANIYNIDLNSVMEEIITRSERRNALRKRNLHS